jgi:oligoribonuclease (3'-5' exoribonuclease)
MSINDDALIWIDLEMDGLDLTKNFILEIACIVTDFHLTNIHEGIVFLLIFFIIISIFFRSGSCYSSSKIFT